MRPRPALLAAASVLSLPLLALAQIQVPPGGVKLPKGDLAPLPGPSRPLFPKLATPNPAPEIQAAVIPADSIFPAVLFAGANIRAPLPASDIVLGEGAGDNAPVVYVVPHAANVPVTVTISCDEVMDPSTFKGTLAKPDETYVILPKIRWKYRALAQSRQQMPVNVVFQIKVGNREPVEQVRTCSLRTIHDCPLQFEIGGQITKLPLVLAAYVNEDHPWVDALLKDALATGLVDAFLAYQLPGDEPVLKQVEAIWRALQRRNISYSSITNIAAPQDQHLQSQHVRFLDESIQQQQANCIDGTVMLASVLRKVGIHPKIVVVPGHAFLAFALDAQGTRWRGLETTCIGQAKLAIGRDFAKESPASFQQALAIGSANLQKDAARFRSADPKDSGYLTIDIDEARQLGVRPIPYTPVEAGKEAPPRLIRIR